MKVVYRWTCTCDVFDISSIIHLMRAFWEDILDTSAVWSTSYTGHREKLNQMHASLHSFSFLIVNWYIELKKLLCIEKERSVWKLFLGRKTSHWKRYFCSIRTFFCLFGEQGTTTAMTLNKISCGFFSFSYLKY